MKTSGAALLSLALLVASVASVVCVDLLLLPELWPMEIDGWSLTMVRAAAFGAGGLGALGGGLALTSWSNKGLAGGMTLMALAPAVVFLTAGDQLALGAVAQLAPESVGSVTQRYPHLRVQISALQASKHTDPHLAYLTRANAAATQAEREALAEAELARVMTLPEPARLTGLKRLSMSPVRAFAHPAAAALRLELHGPRPGPPGYKALESLVLSAVDRDLPMRERGVIIDATDSTPARFRSYGFWTTCNLSGRANAAGLLSRGKAGRFVLRRTATVGESTYTHSKSGEDKRVQYPVFSGYAAVLDAEGREIFRHEVPPGSLKLDARMLHKAGDDLAYKLSKSLSAKFCLKISEPFGGL